MMEYDHTVKSSCHVVEAAEEAKSYTMGSISINMKGLLEREDKLGSPKEMLIVERNEQGEESSDGEPTGDSFV